MDLNADFSQRIVVTPEHYRWEASPMPGVERMKLDRIGDEVARATSLVRYHPNSQFSAHEHGGGEEIFVLGGSLAMNMAPTLQALIYETPLAPGINRSSARRGRQFLLNCINSTRKIPPISP